MLYFYPAVGVGAKAPARGDVAWIQLTLHSSYLYTVGRIGIFKFCLIAPLFELTSISALLFIPFAITFSSPGIKVRVHPRQTRAPNLTKLSSAAIDAER
jgi:hypothetical protein